MKHEGNINHKLVNHLEWKIEQVYLLFVTTEGEHKHVKGTNSKYRL